MRESKLTLVLWCALVLGLGAAFSSGLAVRMQWIAVVLAALSGRFAALATMNTVEQIKAARLVARFTEDLRVLANAFDSPAPA